MAKTLADILIPLAGSISNEKALAMRKACDELEAKVETLKLRVNGLESMVLELKDATKNIALHTDETLRALAQRVEALEQIRISHEADYSKSASVFADRIEALDRALSAAAEDNGDLDVRVPALERASAKNTGEGHGVAGSTPAGPSRSTTMPSPASPWDAYLEVMNAGHPGVSYRDIQRLAVDAAVRAMKNTGEGEVEHAASVSRSVSAKDASRATTPNNAEEGASAMRHGSGARPDATSLSTACPLCHGMLSEDECKKQNTPSPQGSTASAERSVRVDVVHANDGTPLMAAAHVAQPLTGGEGVPAWVPSVEEIQQFIDDGREGDLRALIASRAPAQPSVEEMAERLRVARNAWAGYAPGVVISPSDCWLALDRAAIGGGK